MKAVTRDSEGVEVLLLLATEAKKMEEVLLEDLLTVGMLLTVLIHHVQPWVAEEVSLLLSDLLVDWFSVGLWTSFH